jgi:hypothetical protein
MNEQQPIMISPFGPVFLKFQLPNDMLTALLEESEIMKSKTQDDAYIKEYDWSEYLVGKNTNQLLLTYDFFVQSNLQSFLVALGEFYLQSHHSTDDDVKNTKLAIAAAWLNVTKKHDYNCIHDHNKSPLSGIIYLKEDASIGEEIDRLEENSKIKGGSYLPGVTHFIYSANKNFLDSTSFSFRGKPGDVLIFPGWVSHLVNPFTADGERMTVAFNYHNDENVIHKYPKEMQ